MRRITWLAIATCLLILIGGCTQNLTGKVTQKQEVVIGVSAPLTGPLAVFGEWMQEGYSIALEEINTQGGINIKEIRLVYEDSQCMPKQSVTSYNALKFKNVDAYMGSFCGSEVKAAAQWAENNKEVILSPGNNFGRLNDYFFSTEHLISAEAKFLAKESYNLGLRRIAIIGINNDWGLMHKETFTKEFEKLGGEITETQIFNSDAETDFRTYLTKIKRTNPDAIFIARSVPINILNQIKELGINAQIIGERGIQSQITLDLAPEGSEGIIYSYPGKQDEEKSESTKRFIQKYKEKYNKEPHIVVINSYDALKIMAQALEICREPYEAECLSDYVKNLEEFDGARGFVTYEGSFWEMRVPFHLRTVKKGEFVVLE